MQAGLGEGAEAGRENLKQAPSPAWSPKQGLISGPEIMSGAEIKSQTLK